MTENKDVNSDIEPSKDENQQSNSLSKTEEAVATSEAPHTSSAPTQKALTEHTKSGKSSLASGVAIAISVASLGMSGWLYYQSLESNTDAQLSKVARESSALASQVNQQTARINQISNSANEAISASKSASQALVSTNNKISEATKQLSVIQSKIETLNNVSKEDWQLAEAQYLIRLANQRLLLEKDHTNALALLNNADRILADMEDPILFDTRKAIAKDIQALKSVGAFDLEGYYLQLNALHDSVSSLPQFEPSKEWQKQETHTDSEASSEVNSVAEVANSFWQGLKSLVIINYDRKPIKTLLPPAEYQELVTGIQLQIEVAQVALVKGEKVIYQSALEKIAEAVSTHFDVDAKTTNAFLTSLTALQQVNPDQKLPLPRASLSAIKILMTQWNEATQVKIEDTVSSKEKVPEAVELESEQNTAPSTTTSPAEEAASEGATI